MTILVQQQLSELAQAAPHKDWRAGSYYGKPFLADIEVLADTPEGLVVVMQGNQNFTAESVAAGAFVGAASPATVLALLDELDQLKAALQEERQMRARIGRAANWLCGYAEGRNSFSRIKEINDAIQEVPDGH